MRLKCYTTARDELSAEIVITLLRFMLVINPMFVPIRRFNIGDIHPLFLPSFLHLRPLPFPGDQPLKASYEIRSIAEPDRETVSVHSEVKIGLK